MSLKKLPNGLDVGGAAWSDKKRPAVMTAGNDYKIVLLRYGISVFFAKKI
jgi:hypothetical protein